MSSQNAKVTDLVPTLAALSRVPMTGREEYRRVAWVKLRRVPLGLRGSVEGSSVTAFLGTDIFTSSVFQICPEKRPCHAL